MKALVTGGTGFVGRHLVAELLNDGWTVAVLARHRSRARGLANDVAIIEGELDDEAALRRAVDAVDVVFHLAAATAGPWETHHRVTVEGTRRMLAIAREASVDRFVHVSSIVVYDKRGLPPGALVDESARLLEPVPSAGPYARGKLEAERLVRDSPASAPEVVIVRPGLVYGRGHLAFNHLGELFGATRIAYGRPSLLLPLVEARSCARALLEVARSPRAAGRTYHVVDAHVTTRRDYLAALGGLTGHRERVIYLPAGPVAAACGALGALGRLARLPRAGDWSADKVRARAVELRYDTAALERDTGWRPQPTLERGLERALGARSNAGPGDRPIRATARRSPRPIERIGIIGAGAMARAHIDALEHVRGARITGVLDTRLEAAESLASEIGGGAAAFDDEERFFAEAAPKLVHVVTPPQQHAPVALAALRRGAHVLIEKPATITLEECDSLICVADQCELTIGVDETVAFDPLVRRTCALLANGVLGELVHVDVHMGYDLRRGGRLERIVGDSESWERRLPGGPLEDLLPHPLSIVRTLAGPLALDHSRSECTGRLPADFPDELRLSLASDGVTASISLSLSSRPDDLLVTVHGTRASVRIDVQNVLFDCLTPLPGPRSAARGLRVLRSGMRMLAQTAGNAVAMAAKLKPTPASSRHLIFAHHAALASGRPPPAPLSAARADIAIARTIWPLPADAAAAIDETRARVRAV